MQNIADRFIIKAESLGYQISISDTGRWGGWTHEAQHRKNKSILFQFDVSGDPLTANKAVIRQFVQSSISGVSNYSQYWDIDEFERINPAVLEELHKQLTASRSAARAAKLAMQQAIRDEGRKIKDLIDQLKM